MMDAMLITGIGVYRSLDADMDRVVIANMRVFRVQCIFNKQWTMMPVGRILDITVAKPLLGRIFD